MTNIQTIDFVKEDGTTVFYVQIENEDGSFTSMPKALYDTLPSNSSIPQAGE
jgi:hypothetical protein